VEAGKNAQLAKKSERIKLAADTLKMSKRACTSLNSAQECFEIGGWCLRCALFEGQ